jgi:hypothetical protein
MSKWSKFTLESMKFLDRLKINKFNIGVLDFYYKLIIPKYQELDNFKLINYKKYFIGSKPEVSVNPKKFIKSYLLYILIEIKSRYPHLLQEIFSKFEFTKNEIDSTNKFIDEINKKTFKYCLCWINLQGTKLLRGIYYLLVSNRLPQDIKTNIIIKTPDIYGEFASLDLQKYIETYINYSHNFSVVYKDLSLELSINTNKCYKIEKYQNNLIKRSLILGLLHQKKQKLKLNLWFTSMKKVLPKDYNILGPKEINSGSSSPISGISIWRLEECSKLLLHETIHALNLDFRESPNELKNICNHFDVGATTDIKFVEAYTEIWACITNCILCSFELNNTPNYKLCLKLIEYERKFTCYQIAKILTFFGFKEMSDFKQNCRVEKKFNQTTSVFSYFFIKGIFLYYLEDFLNHCKQTINIMDYNTNVDELYKLFLSLSNRSEMDKDINNIINKFKTGNLNTNINESLRMTCIELENKN